jgi:uncharacterized protein (DUF924 family)
MRYRAAVAHDFEEVLGFWFGPLDEAGHSDAAHTSRWWKKDPAFDTEIRTRFGPLHQAVLAGERDHWLATARGRLAFIIVLDQLSRNMLRGSPQAFAGDERAAEVAVDGIAGRMDHGLSAQERGFFYMPLVHSERLDLQDRAVELFRALGGASSLKYAEQHREIIRRFARFPHRNAVLGRTSTAEEMAFLQQPGSSF